MANQDTLDEPVDIQEVFANVQEALVHLSVEELMELHNRICDKQIEYVEDSLFWYTDPVLHTKVCVKWDTDGEETNLPLVVEIPDGLKTDDIADWLSDEYGWCVSSFNFDVDASNE